MELMGRFYRALLMQISENMGMARLAGIIVMFAALLFLGIMPGVIISVFVLVMLFQASSR